MTTLYYTLPCQELGCDPVEDRFTPDDSFVSLPSDYCFLYAAAYRLGLISRKDMMLKNFPPVMLIKMKLYNMSSRLTEELSLFIRDMLLSGPNQYHLVEDQLLDVSPICLCEAEEHSHSTVLEALSDLVAIRDDELWHMYFNPHGTPTKRRLGISLTGCLGGKNKRKNKKTQVVVVPKVASVNAVPQPKPKKKANRITPAGQFLRKIGGIAGGFLGNRELGTTVGAGISRIFGQGDYQIQRNSLMSGGPPSFSPLNSGIRFTHREYLADIFSSTSYSVRNYRLQPNSPATFPWLSQLAASFEQYKFSGCVFYLNTTSGNAISSTNNALGVWGITSVYDPTRPPLASKIQAEEYNGCTAGVPSISLLHPVECKPKSDVLDRYYVDYSNSITGEDLKFYDHANVNVFTQGQQQAGINLGELWVSYDITFYNPRVQPLAEDNLVDHYSINGTQVTATNPCGTVNPAIPKAGSGLGTTIDTSTNGVGRLTLPSGTSRGYYLVIYAYGGGNSTANISINMSPGTANMTNAALLQNSLGSSYIAPFPTSVTVSGYTVINTFFKSDTASAIVNINASLMPTSASNTVMDIFCIPLGAGITVMEQASSVDTKLNFDDIIREYLIRNKIVKVDPSEQMASGSKGVISDEDF